MLKQLQRMIVALTARGQQRADQKLIRDFMGLMVSLVRSPGTAGEKLDQISAVEARFNAEVATWVSPEALAAGQGGPFDAGDLRHWLALAERAGVPYVPARVVLELNEEEMALASGQLQIPDTALTRGVRRRAQAIPELRDAPAPQPEDPEERRRRSEALLERLFGAMDDVPMSWVVRSGHGGSDELKALAGSGLIDKTESPSVSFGSELEVGPGWIREGNRRRINAADSRTVMLAARGPGGEVFVARPWMEADRYVETDDPHRHGSIFAGKGRWPLEWRAFVSGGEVTGVASYYAWTGKTTPLNARMALEVRDLAQRIVDEAVRQRAWPRFMDVELARDNPKLKQMHPEVAAAIEGPFGRETVAGSLDFMEVKGQGLMLLEGGPGHTPLGGAHPCAFAGTGGPPRFGQPSDVRGVALQLIDGVSLADPKTWNDGDRHGRILSWDEAAVLAAEYEAEPATAPTV